MTEEKIKEQISMAYAEAISAHAGMTCEKYIVDYGMDGKFNDIQYDPTRRRYRMTGYGIDFQLKATVNVGEKDGKIIYDLEAKNYNDLREENIGCPRILVLYQLPRNRKEWVEVLEDKTVLRKRAWWFSLNGAKTVANKESVRIKIPETQILSPDELVILMNRVKKGELL